MDKKEILDILDNAKDDRGAVPMRLVRQALDKLSAIQPISSVQPKPDCVSRQAAIDAIMGQPPEPHYPSWYAAQIEKLPAAQPDHVADSGKKVSISCDHENDLVSRKAAIEAIEKIAVNERDTDRGLSIFCGFSAAIIVIDNLPSAQPERKKPVFKTGESIYHVSYADGTGGFEKNKWADWTCPDCGWFVGEQYIPRRRNQQKCNYCAKCGCAIDWSDADMRGEQDG